MRRTREGKEGTDLGRLFGTDGVRGVANSQLTPSLAFRIGQAGAYVLSKEHPHPRIVIGKDTRISGDMLEAALICGICSVGADVVRVGVLPTPGIALLTRTLDAVSYTHLRAHETRHDLVCRLLLEKKKKKHTI